MRVSRLTRDFKLQRVEQQAKRRLTDRKKKKSNSIKRLLVQNLLKLLEVYQFGVMTVGIAGRCRIEEISRSRK